MESVSSKTIGIAVLFVAFLLGAANSIARTGFSILDTNSATYIIIVMLMTFAFIAFYLKEDVRITGRRRDIAIGAGLFAAYVVIVSYLRVAMSFAFATYRIDGIMFPLLIASLVITLFGLKSIRKFNKLIVYSMFASPLLLMPIILANGAFANINADLVYGILKAVGVNAVKNGIAITGASASTITIASTCVPLGIFIATVMLLLPLAYLYDGKLKMKALWIATAVAAVVVMNVIRMSVIALEWASSGIAGAIALFHLFAGELIFYMVIVLFVLLAGKFGLTLRGRAGSRKPSASAVKFPLYPVFFALLYGALAFILAIPYAGMLYASPAHFYTAYNATGNPQQLVGIELGALDANGFNVSNAGSMGSFEIYSVTSAGSNSTAYVLSGYLNRPVPGVQMFRNTSVTNVSSTLLPNGISLVSAISESNGTTFDLNYFSAPYVVNGSEISINYEVFARANDGLQTCGPSAQNAPQPITNAVNRFESALYNVLAGHFSSSEPLCYSYGIAGGAS